MSKKQLLYTLAFGVLWSIVYIQFLGVAGIGIGMCFGFAFGQMFGKEK